MHWILVLLYSNGTLSNCRVTTKRWFTPLSWRLLKDVPLISHSTSTITADLDPQVNTALRPNPVTRTGGCTATKFTHHIKNHSELLTYYKDEEIFQTNSGNVNWSELTLSLLHFVLTNGHTWLEVWWLLYWLKMSQSNALSTPEMHHRLIRTRLVIRVANWTPFAPMFLYQECL